MPSMRVVGIILLVFVILLGYLLIKYERSEYEKISQGKALYEEVRASAPKCWIPERRVLFSVGCPVGSDEIRTELSIVLSSCICEAKGLPHVVCEKSKLSACHMNRNCLYECGMKYGIYVSQPRMGFNVFERMFETVPLMCKYILNTQHRSIEAFDWDLFQEIIFSTKKGLMEEYTQILARPGDYTLPHLMNLQLLLLEQISNFNSFYHYHSFRDYVRDWSATPAFWYTILIGIIVFFVLAWIFGNYWCK